jgi:hypothetical protein
MKQIVGPKLPEDIIDRMNFVFAGGDLQIGTTWPATAPRYGSEA